MEKPLWARRDVSWSPTIYRGPLATDNQEGDMHRHIITPISLALICSQMAHGNQAPPPKSRGQSAADIKVYPASGKQIRIVAGARRALVQLTHDVSGCLELFDPHTPKWRSKQPLWIKVIDKVRK